MRNFYRSLHFLLGALMVLLAPTSGAGQQLELIPDRPDGIYAVGDQIGWTVAMEDSLQRTLAASGPVTYTIRRDGKVVLDSGELELSSEPTRIETSLDRPGMVQVEIRPTGEAPELGDRSTGGPGRVFVAAAVDPTGIEPAEPAPADFWEFWEDKLRELEAVPMAAVNTPEESGVPGVHYESIRLDNIKGARVYGQLARPVGQDRLPGLVIYQWAGGPYPLQKEWVTERAAEGWLALNVMPHDVPHDMPQEFYDALPALIRRYPTIGRHSREESHFLQMYLGAYRAIEYLAGRPEWDGETLVVMGTSMGGQQSLAVAGLNPRVTALIVHVPAGADVTATLHGRAPSYPNWDVTRPEVLTTARYFDAANFARRIAVPSLVSMGFIDEVTTPTSIWAAFNQIQGPREAAPLPDAPHNHQATADQQLPYTTRASEWLRALVRGEAAPVNRRADGLDPDGR